MENTTEGNSTPPSHDTPPTNKFVLKIWKERNAVKRDGCKSVLTAIGKEEGFCNMKSLQTNLEALVNKERKFRKNSKLKDEYCQWLKEPYHLPTARPPSQTPPKPRCLVCETCPVLQETNLHLAREISQLQDKLKQAEEGGKVKELKNKRRRRSVTLEGVRTASRSHLQQAIHRKQKVIEKLRRERRNLKLVVAEKEKCISKLRKQLDGTGDAPHF